MATLVSPCWKTIARAVSSPCLPVAGLPGPTPPETGRRGSGVMIALPTPTLSSACANEVNEQVRMRSVRSGVGAW